MARATLSTWLGRAEAAATGLALLSAGCLLLISVATSVDVILRGLFNRPIEGLYDVDQMLLLVVIGACFPLASLRGQHISVGILADRFGPRARRWIEMLRSLTLMGVLAVFAWQLGKYAADQWQYPVYSQHLGWPMHVWWAICAAGVALAVPAELVSLLRRVTGAR